MCGRYASSRGAEYLVDHFEVDEPPEQVLPPSWNVAPTDPAYVVAVRHEHRVLRVARWGLVPSWAQPGRPVAKRAGPLINARRETVATTPAFRAAFARRRCLVPADGYYEWQTEAQSATQGQGPGRGSRRGVRKQPWYLTSRDGAPLAMAGLYEVRRDEAAEGQEAGQDAGQAGWSWSCAILTTSAPDDLGRIHDRTPLLVPRDQWARWLDPGTEHPGDDLLVPGTPGLLDAWPVGPAVGNVRNDGPELVVPAPPDPGTPTLLD